MKEINHPEAAAILVFCENQNFEILESGKTTFFASLSRVRKLVDGCSVISLSLSFSLSLSVSLGLSLSLSYLNPLSAFSLSSYYSLFSYFSSPFMFISLCVSLFSSIRFSIYVFPLQSFSLSVSLDAFHCKDHLCLMYQCLSFVLIFLLHFITCAFHFDVICVLLCPIA